MSSKEGRHPRCSWPGAAAVCCFVTPFLPPTTSPVRACELEPANPAFLRSLGLALRNGGQHEQAIAVLSRLLARQADDEAALQARGCVAGGGTAAAGAG